MKNILLFNNDYDSESLGDMLQDIEEHLYDDEIETDEYGYSKGTYTVAITYKEDM